MKRRSLLISAPALLTGCATAQSRPDNAALVKRVTDTELAFAKTMADRDHAAFASFLADETVFLMGGKPQRGKRSVADYWKRFYTEPKAKVVEIAGVGHAPTLLNPYQIDIVRAFLLQGEPP